MTEEKKVSFIVSLISGGIAGTTVDVALFPLDTIKTRLQSAKGFHASGGFNGIYKGLGAVTLGSAPGAALFFSTYEMLKHQLSKSTSIPLPFQHMLAASTGEVVACLIRVPTEVVKQRMQAGLSKSISETVSKCMEVDGISGLYKGFGITIMREIPFSLIQFPIYEGMKNRIKQYVDRPVGPLESASCGSFSGAIAAAATTPLDVIKTRLMLGSDSNGIPYNGAIECTKRIYQEGLAAGGSNGVTKVFFSGVQPRVMWISIGGFVFFGAYEAAKNMFTF